MKSVVALLFFCLASAFRVAGAADAPDIPAVAAAADLKYALAEAAQAFEKDSGRKLRISFGSSGNFTQQIEQGAPFELFLSADEAYVFRLADQGLTADRGAAYAVGRLVLFVPQGSPLKADGTLADLKAALADGRLKRFAIANPEHAPYGRAARAVLQHAGLWAELQPKLVLGENASQATQFAAAGSSQGGIVPLALSKAPEIARLGQFAPLPAEWHAAEPLRQRMVLTKKAADTARGFYAWLQTPAARSILQRHGFTLPAER
jgi:molybdate transport system substrate-binding protein